jgi:hypothetical protein
VCGISTGNVITETYLGVAFQSSQESIEFNKPFIAQLVLMYYPHPIYESLVPEQHLPFVKVLK